MRRVAAELGTGAASLYRYVETREDLLDLMTDAISRRSTSSPRQAATGSAEPYRSSGAGL